MSPAAQLNAALAGRYEIEREIGRGGMATVFLARDLRHHRRVALKVLDPELGAVLGADRFLSEIRVTANLQHPNLLPLFDSGEAGGLLFYVMPFVEGETLRARIDREKQLPIAEAVRIASAIASALDYAHRHDVIHRDLKPENILLQEDQPLIADFGIALAVSKAGGTRVTQTGLSLGTPQYMSPEQATGDRGIDARTDIYSLGALTYEMLSGEPPHVGTTSQAIIARLMTEEPRPLTASRRAVPDHVDGAVRCALEKLPADRFQTAKEFGDALNGRVAAPTMGRTGAGRAASKRSLSAASLGVLAAAILGTAAVTWLLASRSRIAPAPIRFEITPPGQTLMDPSGVSVAVSRDGQSVAYLALAGGRTMVHLRRLTEWQGRALPGTEGAWDPRISPDGRWILFGVGGQPKKVPVEGGAPINLQGGMNWTGISWGVPETIVLAGGGRLHAFSPNGGTPRVIADPDSASGVVGVNDPFVFPDGSLVAFRVTKPGGAYLATVPLSGGDPTIFDFAFANAIGYDQGWMIFGRSDGTIAAVELKDGGRKVGDRVVQLLEGASFKTAGGVVAALSPSGTLAYLEGDRAGRMVFLDGKGAAVGSGNQVRFFYDPQFSPDGKRVAASIVGNDRSEIWILEIATNTLSLLTRGSRPAWTPDGKRIVYVADSTRFLFSIPADLSGPSEQIADRMFHEVHVSPDGRQVVARGPNRAMPNNRNDIFLIPLDGDRTPVALLATPAHEVMPRISPDGRWLAYASDESGEYEVYVRPLQGGARTQVSAGGGVQPVWAPDGKRIYYINNTVLQAVVLQSSQSSLEVLRRDSLFSVNLRGNPTAHQTYDISPDGKRFVGIDAQGSGLKLKVVVNWLTEARVKLK